MNGSLQLEEEVARLLLEIGAVSLSPKDPYVWASGIRSPVYCDCRRIISFPKARTVIEGALAAQILEQWPDVQALVGVATGGIPHAAFVADRLSLPLAYVRSKSKGHGLGKRIEGVVEKNTRVVVIEDLVSTGSSLLEAVRCVSGEGARVIGAMAIFTYEAGLADENFRKEGIPLLTLTRFSAVRKVAEKAHLLSPEELKLLDNGMKDVTEQLERKGE